MTLALVNRVPAESARVGTMKVSTASAVGGNIFRLHEFEALARSLASAHQRYSGAPVSLSPRVEARRLARTKRLILNCGLNGEEIICSWAEKGEHPIAPTPRYFAFVTRTDCRFAGRSSYRCLRGRRHHSDLEFGDSCTNSTVSLPSS